MCCMLWLCGVQCARLLLLEGGADPCHVRQHTLTLSITSHTDTQSNGYCWCPSVHLREASVVARLLCVACVLTAVCMSVCLSVCVCLSA